MTQPIKIFAEDDSNRLRYVASFVFVAVAGREVKWLSSDEKDLADIYYAMEDTSAFRIMPSGHLSDGAKLDWRDVQSFPEDLLALPPDFDYLSFIFRHLSRFEEGEAEHDVHGRFISSQSWSAKNGWLDRPIVDHVVRLLFSRFNANSTGEPLEVLTKYAPKMTIDVDLMYAYKRRGLVRSLGGVFKDVFRLNFQRVISRGRVLLGIDADPYDKLSWMLAECEKFEIPVELFFLVKGGAKFDRQIALKSTDFTDIPSDLKIGVHPSYDCRSSQELKSEKTRLEQLTGRDISSSRFHYLRFKLPEGYNILEASGITEDNTMSFSDNIGFRAGTSYPFLFYDLVKERKTALKVIPSIAMDVILKNELLLGKEDAVNSVQGLLHEVKESKGVGSLIWHNSSFDQTEGWNGWDEVFVNILKQMRPRA